MSFINELYKGGDTYLVSSNGSAVPVRVTQIEGKMGETTYACMELNLDLAFTYQPLSRRNGKTIAAKQLTNSIYGTQAFNFMKYSDGLVESCGVTQNIAESYYETREKAEQAYNRLVNCLHDKKATKADMTAAMEEAVGYLGEVLDI